MVSQYSMEVGAFEVPQYVLEAAGIDKSWTVREVNFVPSEVDGAYRMFVSMQKVTQLSGVTNAS